MCFLNESLYNEDVHDALTFILLFCFGFFFFWVLFCIVFWEATIHKPYCPLIILNIGSIVF